MKANDPERVEQCIQEVCKLRMSAMRNAADALLESYLWDASSELRAYGLAMLYGDCPKYDSMVLRRMRWDYSPRVRAGAVSSLFLALKRKIHKPTLTQAAHLAPFEFFLAARNDPSERVRRTCFDEWSLFLEPGAGGTPLDGLVALLGEVPVAWSEKILEWERGRPSVLFDELRLRAPQGFDAIAVEIGEDTTPPDLVAALMESGEMAGRHATAARLALVGIAQHCRRELEIDVGGMCEFILCSWRDTQEIYDARPDVVCEVLASRAWCLPTSEDDPALLDAFAQAGWHDLEN